MGGEPVIPLSLARIARVTGGQLGHGDPDAVVSGEVVIDSRRAGPGGLFAAVAGERSDGHDFAAAAVAAGATAVLATRPVTVPSVLVTDVPAALAALARSVVDALPAVRSAGITGSSGKTSTKDLAAQLVERLGPTIAPAGSYNNEFGHPLTVLRADAATRYLVLELSARGIGHIAYLCRIAPPRYGVVLNALAAAALARELGMGLDAIADGLGAAVARSRWRMEVHQRPDGVTVINDAYNANPESVRAAIDALAHLAHGGRAFAILGHMAELGDTSRASHEDIGEYAARIGDSGLAGLIAVGEEAAPLLDGARRVRSWTGEALAAPDGAAALELLANRLKPSDVVLVKASRAAHLEGVAAALEGEAGQ